MRLHDFLAYRARERPHAEFALHGDRCLAYRQAQVATNRLANALAGAGLRRGDRIAVLAKNCLEYPLLDSCLTSPDAAVARQTWRERRAARSRHGQRPHGAVGAVLGEGHILPPLGRLRHPTDEQLG
jgi:hypothetical protein